MSDKPLPNNLDQAAELLRRWATGYRISEEVHPDDEAAVVLCSVLLAATTELRRIADALQRNNARMPA